jgi:hypothetical protein
MSEVANGLDGWLEDTMHEYREMEIYDLAQPTRVLCTSPRWLVTGGCSPKGNNEVCFFVFFFDIG